MTRRAPRPLSLRAQALRRVLGPAIRTARRFGGGGIPDPQGPVAELEAYALKMRASLEQMAARAPGSRGVSVHEERDAPVPGLWVVSEEAREDRVILHVHGGAYCMCSPRTHRGLAAGLSRSAAAAVFLPEYRLAPEHQHPDGLDDVHAAYRWLVTERDVDPARLALSGDSAGGGLAAALLVRLREQRAPLPACFAAMSPWMDLAGTGASMRTLDGADPWLSAAMIGPAARAYAGQTALDDPALSPLYADHTGFPPTLVHVGGDEILLDDAVRFVAACRRRGVDASLGTFDGLWHVFQAFPGMPESRDSLREIGAFVRRHVPDTAPEVSATREVA